MPNRLASAWGPPIVLHHPPSVRRRASSLARIESLHIDLWRRLHRCLVANAAGFAACHYVRLIGAAERWRADGVVVFLHSRFGDILCGPLPSWRTPGESGVAAGRPHRRNARGRPSMPHGAREGSSSSGEAPESQSSAGDLRAAYRRRRTSPPNPPPSSASHLGSRISSS